MKYKPMKLTYVFFMLFLLTPSHSQASKWQEYQHGVKMSLCQINHISMLPVIDIKRISIEEHEEYCKNRNLETDTENFQCMFLKESSYSRERKKRLGENIKNLYASRIANAIGVGTTDTPPTDSFLGQLHIKVNYSDGIKQNGKIFYFVNHNVTLQERALSRSDRAGFMDLERWYEFQYAVEGIENADMAALNLVTKVVNKMKETFQEAREYCAKQE